MFFYSLERIDLAPGPCLALGCDPGFGLIFHTLLSNYETGFIFLYRIIDFCNKLFTTR